MTMDFGSSVSTSIFAYVLMAVIAMLAAVLVRGIVIALQAMQDRQKAAATPTPVSIIMEPALDDAAAHAAVVAAAVYAILGERRIVRIGEVGRSPMWTTAGRTAHQLSHAPRRTGR